MIQLVVSDYLKPNNLEEAYELLLSEGKNLIIAGGAWIKLAVKSADRFVSLEKLGLDRIDINDDQIVIGSMTTLRAIETNQAITNLCDGILSKACGNIMGINVRNIATIGGSIMGRLAFSDVLPALLALDAKLVFYRAGEVAISEYLKTPSKAKDILLQVVIPQVQGRGFFKKVATTPLDFAIINFAIAQSNGTYRISVGSTPYIAALAEETMSYLNGLDVVSESDIDKATEIALSEIKTSDNIRASKTYRTELIKAYIKRGIRQVTNHVG